MCSIPDHWFMCINAEQMPELYKKIVLTAITYLYSNTSVGKVL